jgi:hypothetical protein
VVSIGLNTSGELEGTVKFAAEETTLANEVWNLFKGGYVRAFSAGFISHTYDWMGDTLMLKDNELIEMSAVAVPANALALAKSKGIDSPEMDSFVVAPVAAPEAKTEDVVTAPEVKEPEIIVPEPEEKSTEEVNKQEVIPKEDMEVSNKGKVADEIAELTEYEKKYANVKPIQDVYWAFMDAYFDEETNSSEFDTLLSEFSGIVSQMVSGDETKGRIVDNIKDVNKSNVEAILNKKTEETVVVDTPTEPETPVETVVEVTEDVPAVEEKHVLSRNRQINKAIRSLLKKRV